MLEAGAIYYWVLGISKIALISGLISDSCLAKGYKRRYEGKGITPNKIKGIKPLTFRPKLNMISLQYTGNKGVYIAYLGGLL